MDTVDLAYVGRGPHEELVAHIADQEDFYADEGVHVVLRDGSVWDPQRLRRGATIGLGRTVLSRLNTGIPWVTLTVNTHCPLFWFLARPGLETLQDLAGRRLAIHPPHTGPGVFARIVLRRAGIDPDRDIQPTVRMPGDFGMDLRWLRAGTVDAAVVGDTFAADAVAAEHGWRVLAFVGDHFRIPTTGVAVDPTFTDPDDPAIQALVRAHRRALKVIHEDPDTTIRHLATFLGGQTEEEVRQHYARYYKPYFTTDGQVDEAVAAQAITAVAAELGVPATFTAAEFYRTEPVGATTHG
ncbi:ABC transporter substrate-binding protein [Kutzneria sp. 744]|uniref:ABC transporter substrate-binding protein n=1 Tax=Kutzneria sp. (strain 744) TaxID=345341 RepID=UPI0003EEACEE|nr:ABC transporter substrate-binding protein [Kutzneria sp. 744]EWM19474.1 OmpA/MotB protein [Kutzneria sp. 744]